MVSVRRSSGTRSQEIVRFNLLQAKKKQPKLPLRWCVAVSVELVRADAKHGKRIGGRVVRQIPGQDLIEHIKNVVHGSDPFNVCE